MSESAKLLLIRKRTSFDLAKVFQDFDALAHRLENRLMCFFSICFMRIRNPR